MKQDYRLLILLVPCGALLLFGTLTCSQTVMAGVAEMGAPLDATAKNVLGRSVMTAWAGVAGAANPISADESATSSSAVIPKDEGGNNT